jgi:hypothetical protein
MSDLGRLIVPLMLVGIGLVITFQILPLDPEQFHIYFGQLYILIGITSAVSQR